MHTLGTRAQPAAICASSIFYLPSGMRSSTSLYLNIFFTKCWHSEGSRTTKRSVGKASPAPYRNFWNVVSVKQSAVSPSMSDN